MTGEHVSVHRIRLQARQEEQVVIRPLSPCSRVGVARVAQDLAWPGLLRMSPRCLAFRHSPKWVWRVPSQTQPGSCMGRAPACTGDRQSPMVAGFRTRRPYRRSARCTAGPGLVQGSHSAIETRSRAAKSSCKPDLRWPWEQQTGTGCWRTSTLQTPAHRHGPRWACP